MRGVTSGGVVVVALGVVTLAAFAAVAWAQHGHDGSSGDGHKTAQAYRGYAKETIKRALAATRKRHAHLLAQKQLEQQNTDGAAASARDETNGTGMMRQPASTTKASVGPQR